MRTAHRQTSRLLIAASMAFGATGQARAVEPTAELLAAVDAYLDDRWATGTARLDDLVARVAKEGFSKLRMESILRRGRASYEAEPYVKGKVLRVALACDHVDYETAMLLYVPPSYDPDRAWPLVLIGHGGNSEMSQARAERTARAYVAPWAATGEAKGLILAAPATARGWGRIGNSVLLSAISKLSRKLHVDPDRIYATGHSMGGHMSWRSGIGLADRWGAVSPQSGGYDYVANGQVLRLFNVPGYATFGEREPYDIAKFNRKIKAWMAERDYPWVSVEKKGRGHEIFADQLPKVADFFAAHPRNLYRDRVYVHAAGRMLVDEAEKKRPRWSKAHSWRAGRPIQHQTFHWVRAVPLPDDTPEERRVQRAMVERVSNREIKITATNVRRLRLYLHWKMFDLGKPLRIVANGKTTKVQPKSCDLRKMLELAREFDDRGRVFHDAVDVEVEGDREVPEPRY